MSLAADVGVSQLCKYREELCGDAVSVVKQGQETTVVLSDGLGSGVKANILATLTTNIAGGLLRRQVPMEEVISTIADTLPICRVRGLAYSTLAVVQLRADGQVQLFEYDSPEILLFRDDRLYPIERTARTINGRLISEASFQAQANDVLLLVSDGIFQAGSGKLYELGIGRARLLKHLTKPNSSGMSCEAIADRIMNLAEGYYFSQPGDDCTAVVIRIRPPQRVAVFTGPAYDPADDAKMVYRWLDVAGTDSFRAVCGGTSAQVVGRILRQEVSISCEQVDPSVPPIAQLDGVDLTTEGVLTLNLCYNLLTAASAGEELPRSQDGAALLAKQLWNAEEVHFIVGLAANPAHNSLKQLVHLAPRAHVVDKIINVLRKRRIKVEVEYF